MKKNFLVLLLLFVAVLPTCAFTNELPDPKPGDPNCWKEVKSLAVGWGSIDVRYSKTTVPTFSLAPVLHAWRGERVAAQALIVTPQDVECAALSVTDLCCGSKVISSDCVRRYFERYVLSDLNGTPDTVLVADRLEETASMPIEACTVRPIWLDVRVPQEAKPGTYRAELMVTCDGRTFRLPFRVEVVDRVLPKPADWNFHLDIWQNPYAVARYYNVPLWSEEHFEAMRPIMQMYAEAGGKVITASVIEHPWSCQTYDPFETMVGKFKSIDGTWTYDYSVFDKWVEFMLGCGITGQIDCYSIVPWSYQFEYYDIATNSVKHVDAKPGEQAYQDILLPFLTDFAAHLKAKGWFDIACIAMDERKMDELQAAWEIVKRADPEYRIAGAVDYDTKVVAMMHDVSLVYYHADLPAEILAERKANGHYTTYYTCCNPIRPNEFTFSPLAEAALMGWRALALDYDGYLRWALNSWNVDPCSDTRYDIFPAGDCFLVYPGESSLRWERLVEGIQQYEKVRILQKELSPRQLKRLDAVLEPMRPMVMEEGVETADLIAPAKAWLKSVE